MSCGNLPDTGGPAAWLLLATAACLIIGCLLVSRRRGHRAQSFAVILVLMMGAGLAGAAPSPSRAATNSCGSYGPGTNHDLKITQTSVITDLGPGREPMLIRGLVTNPSHDSTYVTDVTVSITSVSRTIGAPAGPCVPADYVLTHARMVVEQPLAALAGVTFAGARLGFRSTSNNQDACKGAVVHLHYVSTSR
jgi:hypothetical protein